MYRPIAMRNPSVLARLSVPFGAALLLAAGCSSGGDLGRGDAPVKLSGALNSFESCDEALAELKTNALDYIDANGFAAIGSGTDRTGDAENRAPGQDKAADPQNAQPYSRTNTHESGVDEPDIVKTDGRRIVTVRNGKLMVVDAESAELTGSVKLEDNESEYGYLGEADLLLHDDRALVIMQHNEKYLPSDWRTDEGFGEQTTLLLVDLSRKPKVLNSYVIDGNYVDARAIDGMSRVVVHSSPRLKYSDDGAGDLMAARRAAVKESTIDDWLPRFSVDGKRQRVPCEAMARPSEYSASSTLTVLSFDLADKLDDGSPVAIEADGQTVYGSQQALYVANDRQEFTGQEWARPAEPGTEIYRFGITADGPPTFDGTAQVPGFLLNQYSMSEWDGHFRVATTTNPQWTADAENARPSSSAVYVFVINDDGLSRTGEIDGLGKEEQIYAVRFMADVAYVVTFRQTDPLYVVDLSAPSQPTMTGQLNITGYSSYLHPVSDDRLLGIGQEASTEGVTAGTQVSLFNVADSANPVRADQYHLANSYSEAEFDPHAFLYWPDRSLLVLPVYDYTESGKGAGVVLLEVGEDRLTEVAKIKHDSSGAWSGISRSLVIKDTLWTLSESGLLASSLDDYKKTSWLAFD
jgi:uncharacterized secreted protein with C-terminal beta-propeller domain